MANASQYSRKSQFEPAINSVKQAMNYDNDPDISRALSVLYHNYGVSLADQERFDQAINQLQQSLYLNDTPETHKMLAQVYVARAGQKVQRSDRWGAQQDLREAIRHDPYNSNYQTWLNNIS
jgi:Tfp pilus assembly protein PilF